MATKEKSATTSENLASPTSTTSSTPPKYFAAHQYEYEVSPEQPTKKSVTSLSSIPSTRSPSSSSLHKQNQKAPFVVTETSLPMTKTIYLIRHAESDENRRKQCLKASVKGLGKLKLPKKEDVVASMELMNVGAQLDSYVSPRGQEQIDQLGRHIAKDDFVRKMGIQLVAHSPLKRARLTSYGMLQCVASSSTNTEKDVNANDPTLNGSKHPSVSRVVELDILSERTPIEWLPIQHDAFTKRIAEFEMWLCQQPEDVIAVVGHSQYFKDMLGLESKFNNVDVWSCQFDFTVENSIQKVKRDVHVANESETKKKIQKHFENLGSMIQKSNFKRKTSSDSSDVDEKKDDSTADGSCEFEGRDEKDSSLNMAGFEKQTEMDGVCLEELELPRGWRQLRHHYRYNPDSAM